MKQFVWCILFNYDFCVMKFFVWLIWGVFMHIKIYLLMQPFTYIIYAHVFHVEIGHWKPDKKNCSNNKQCAQSKFTQNLIYDLTKITCAYKYGKFPVWEKYKKKLNKIFYIEKFIKKFMYRKNYKKCIYRKNATSTNRAKLDRKCI